MVAPARRVGWDVPQRKLVLEARAARSDVRFWQAPHRRPVAIERSSVVDGCRDLPLELGSDRDGVHRGRTIGSLEFGDIRRLKTPLCK
jgi:hypothetical protein